MAEPPLPQPGSRLYQNWVMLLNGWGFNWYRLENRLRADDLLIRARASDHLAAAGARLRALESAFRQRYLPAPTRQHPYPDPLRLEELHRIQAILGRLTALDTALRGAAAPEDDKIWARHRREAETLAQLAHIDTVLVGCALELAGAIERENLETIVAVPGSAEIDRFFTTLQTALDRRNAMLLIQPGSRA